MNTIPAHQEKVTVYFASEFTGEIRKREGRLIRIDDYTAPGRAHRGADAVIVRRGHRNPEAISSSFWVVVDGWGHPNPVDQRDSPDAPSAPSHSRGLVDDFVVGIGSRLDVRAMLRDKKLSIDDRCECSCGCRDAG